MHDLEQTALTWRKSSRSNGVGGECVEMASAHDRVLVRDSKNPEGPVLAFRSAALGALFGGLRTNGR